MAYTANDGPQDLPDRIGDETSPKRSIVQHVSHITKAFTTKQGLIGTYDYGENWVFSTLESND